MCFTWNKFVKFVAVLVSSPAFFHHQIVFGAFYFTQFRFDKFLIDKYATYVKYEML